MKYIKRGIITPASTDTYGLVERGNLLNHIVEGSLKLGTFYHVCQEVENTPFTGSEESLIIAHKSSGIKGHTFVRLYSLTGSSVYTNLYNGISWLPEWTLIGSGGSGGGTVKWFTDTASRDAYYDEYPDELKSNPTIGVGDPAVAWQWNGTTWIQSAIALQGPKGDKGDKGDTGASSTPPIDGGFLMVPEVLPFDGTNNTFTLQNAPKFASEVLVLKSESFHYLQEGDYSITGNQLTIVNPALQSGDRVKIVYGM